MGHRSSKPTAAGHTDGNTSNTNENNTNKSTTKATTTTKLSKQSSRRHSTRFPKSRQSNKNEDNNSDRKSQRHSIATTLTSNNSSDNNLATALYEGNQFLPILQLERDSIVENTAAAAAVVNNSTGGQIIIKIRFKTHSQSEMDERLERAATTTGTAERSVSGASSSSTAAVVACGETYRLLTDTNSNQMLHVEDVEVRRAAGSSSHNNNNNNARASLPVHLNALRITEPLRDEDDPNAVEYHEINEEEATTSRRNRPDNSSSRRQKAKSAFMNFKSKFESSGHNKATTQLSKVTNANSNINNNNSRTSEPHHHSYGSIPPQSRQVAPTGTALTTQKQLSSPLHSEAIATTITKAASSIYHDTPLRRNLTSNNFSTSSITPPPHNTPLTVTTTSATAIATTTTTLPIQPPIIAGATVATTTTSNPQLAIWTTNSKDVIISSINLLVCPSPTTSTTTSAAAAGTTTASVTTLERLMATELAAAVATTTSNSGELNTTVGQMHQLAAHTPAKHLSSTTPATSSATMLTAAGPIVHSQVDFVHYLVPDLERIFNSSFYWGKMDRYEAERLLEGKPEGTFLLRDSAQEEYLFSVTFRKYGRSLHARIEQNGHKFSFDCHDPAVFSTSTVTGLLEHYKDPGSVMFFEPMLTVPFHRKTVFSLQQLARAAIVSNTSYDGVTDLELPVRLKAYLKEYHYKQKLRVKLLDETLLTCT